MPHERTQGRVSHHFLSHQLEAGEDLTFFMERISIYEHKHLDIKLKSHWLPKKHS